MTWRLSYNHWPIVQGHQSNKTRDTHWNWITLTSIKTRGEIRCPIANTRVNHSKKGQTKHYACDNEFFGTFFSDQQNIFRSDKIFMSVSPNDWQLLSKFREVWCDSEFFGTFFSDRQNIFRSDKIFMSVSPNDWQLLSRFREVCKQTKSVNNRKTVKSVITLTWYRHF